MPSLGDYFSYRADPVKFTTDAYLDLGPLPEQTNIEANETYRLTVAGINPSSRSLRDLIGRERLTKSLVKVTVLIAQIKAKV